MDAVEILELLRVLDIAAEHSSTRSRPLRRYLTDFQNPLEYLDDEDFVERYRLTKAGVRGIMDLLLQVLSNPSERGLPLPPALKLLVVLRFYATGSFEIVAGDVEKISQPSVSRLVKYVSTAIGKMYSNFIVFSEGDAATREAVKFYEKSGFPGVVGAIDCTHIRIQSPGGDDAELFRNRKRFFSLNVQAVCNADMLFTNLVARWRGSVHDSRIFRMSRLKQQFENERYQGI